jgi:hypothetical protein
VNALAVLPSGAILVGADGAGIERSEDGGLTWTAVNEGFSARPHHAKCMPCHLYLLGRRGMA